MPLRNRVTPLGELVAEPGRGMVYGNRGCLHDDAGIIRRAYNGKRWIACRLQFRGWHRSPLLQPGRFTELFFLDEATAMAAGHRACALCRREDFKRLSTMWKRLHPDQAGADAIDGQLHAERLIPETRERRLHELPFGDLPDGTYVLEEATPWLVLDATLRMWTTDGYTETKRRPLRRTARVITPPSLVEVLRAGWTPVVPLVHPSGLRLQTVVCPHADSMERRRNRAHRL